jgi:hypothetical protein
MRKTNDGINIFGAWICLQVLDKVISDDQSLYLGSNDLDQMESINTANNCDQSLKVKLRDIFTSCKRRELSLFTITLYTNSATKPIVIGVCGVKYLVNLSLL